MRRPSSFSSPHSAARAFECVGWSTLLVRLHRHATVALRLAAIDAESAGVFEACDLVNTLIERSLDGTLDWNLPEEATNEEIVSYACTKLYGMRSTLRRKLAHATGDDALDERPDQAPDALAQILERRQIAAVIEAFSCDAEASCYLRMLLSGAKRVEIMSELGITAERADVVRKRIARGVTALCATMNDNGEDEPPSSGPRGFHHVQATEERQGAPPEPYRGAVRANRRR